jgi:hypothetical protein
VDTGGGGGATVRGALEVVAVDSVDPVEPADDAAERSEFASSAARVNLLENGDQVTGSSGSGNDPEPPSRSTTTRM